MTPELIRQILYGTIRIAIVAVAARFSVGLLDQGTIDQITGGLTIVAVAAYAAYSKWEIAKKAAVKVEALKTVVETKTLETAVLRTVVAQTQEETGIMVKALLDNSVPIPDLPPKSIPVSIEQLAADLNQQKLASREKLVDDI